MNEIERELRDSARRVVSELGAAADEGAMWAQIVELGWLLTAVPEDLGGLGLDLDGACVLHAELGRGLSRAPFLPAMLAIDAICASDIAEKAGWIERLTTEFVVTAPLAVSPMIVIDGALSGVASAIQSADTAKHVLICAPDHVLLAPLADAKVSARPTWDESRRLFDARFDGAKLDPKLVLASGEAAHALGARLSAQRDFALAADSAGGAAALFELTVDYLKTRRQFGRPLALFQALKHRCADLKAQVVAAEALIADQLARSAEGQRLAARKAKQLAASVYAWVGEEAIQLHGGIAMTAEHVCHLYVKRALLNLHLGEPIDVAEREIAASRLS